MSDIYHVDPGYRVPLHRHTGDLQGVVMRGRCRYSAESPWLEAGTYVHESDGAVDEILACPEAGPEIMFMVSGPRVEYLGDDGRVVQTDDQASKRSRYQEFCSEHGIAAQDLEHRPAPPLLRDRTGRPSKDVRSR
jgi:2,4'-dihydroxyacetophenone dioxygenase